jgi:hypothetical protein
MILRNVAASLTVNALAGVIRSALFLSWPNESIEPLGTYWG